MDEALLVKELINETVWRDPMAEDHQTAIAVVLGAAKAKSFTDLQRHIYPLKKRKPTYYQPYSLFLPPKPLDLAFRYAAFLRDVLKEYTPANPLATLRKNLSFWGQLVFNQLENFKNEFSQTLKKNIQITTPLLEPVDYLCSPPRGYDPAIDPVPLAEYSSDGNTVYIDVATVARKSKQFRSTTSLDYCGYKMAALAHEFCHMIHSNWNRYGGDHQEATCYLIAQEMWKSLGKQHLSDRIENYMETKRKSDRSGITAAFDDCRSLLSTVGSSDILFYLLFLDSTEYRRLREYLLENREIRRWVHLRQYLRKIMANPNENYKHHNRISPTLESTMNGLQNYFATALRRSRP
jgi:hypothetical protein